MKKGLGILGLLMLLSWAMGSVALAQLGQSGSPFQVRVGAYFPTDSTLTDWAGSTWFQAGLDYALAADESGKNYLSVEYKSKSGTFQGVERKAQIIPVVITKKITPEIPLVTSRAVPYYGLGLGLYNIRAEKANQSSSGTKFGVNLLGGVNISQNAFAEVKYTWISKFRPSFETKDVEYGGLSLDVGMKF